MSPCLVSRQLSFQRCGAAVFNPVDIELACGQVLLIVGANGSGKTTLLRLLSGILKPTAGTIERSHRCAFIGHTPALKADLSCRENLHFIKAFHGPEGSAIGPALGRVGLPRMGRRLARTLSAGQRRRLALAGLLVAQRPVWLLDEPYSSLDHDGTQLVDALIDDHTANGGCVVLSTHLRRPGLQCRINVLDLGGGLLST